MSHKRLKVAPESPEFWLDVTEQNCRKTGEGIDDRLKSSFTSLFSWNASSGKGLTLLEPRLIEKDGVMVTVSSRRVLVRASRSQ